MHYVLEVQTLFYKDMLMQIWLVIKIAGGLASWGMCLLWVKLQQVVALSTTKAEYVAATEASKEMI